LPSARPLAPRTARPVADPLVNQEVYGKALLGVPNEETITPLIRARWEDLDWIEQVAGSSASFTARIAPTSVTPRARLASGPSSRVVGRLQLRVGQHVICADDPSKGARRVHGGYAVVQ
jgi:hypothetical protein